MKVHPLVQFTGCVAAQVGPSQPLEPNVTTIISFDTQVLDTDGFLDPAHPTRITIPKTLNRAIAVIKGSVLLSGGLNPTQYVMELWRNGSPQNTPSGSTAEIGPSGGMGRSLTITTDPFEVDAGDYYELMVFARDGADAVQGGNQASFALVVLGD